VFYFWRWLCIGVGALLWAVFLHAETPVEGTPDTLSIRAKALNHERIDPLACGPVYRALYFEAAMAYLPNELLPYWCWLSAQGKAESAYNPEAVSSAKARGVAQFMDATWREVCRGATRRRPSGTWRGSSGSTGGSPGWRSRSPDVAVAAVEPWGRDALRVSEGCVAGVYPRDCIGPMQVSWLEGVKGAVSGFGGSGVVWLRVLLVLKPVLVSGAMIALAGVVSWLGHTVSKAAALEREVELEQAWREESEKQGREVLERRERSLVAAREAAGEEREAAFERVRALKRRMETLETVEVTEVEREGCGCTLDSPLPEGFE